MQTQADPTIARELNAELIRFERSPELSGLRAHYRPEFIHALFRSMSDPRALDRDAFARFAVGKSAIVLRVVVAFWRFRCRTR